MTVAFVADTHGQYIMTQNLVDLLSERDVETVYHLGDIDDQHTPELFAEFDFYAIYGNHDTPRQRITEGVSEVGEHLGYESMLHLGGQQLFIFHGMNPGRAINIADRENGVQYVLHGHEHDAKRLKALNGEILVPGTAAAWIYEPDSDEFTHATLDEDMMYYESRTEGRDLE